jgi:2-isopropylmalate synthase
MRLIWEKDEYSYVEMLHAMSQQTHAMQPLEIYDTTLRDGAQAEDVWFSVEDKVRVAQKLDELGVHFIEGGWPGANPKDIEFFRIAKTLPFKHAKLVAFGSTRRASNSARQDQTLRSLVEAGTQYVTLFGKSWTLHVTDALGIPLKKNLELIEDSIAFLSGHKRRVFYDAEHFFDGYKANPEYALQTLLKAQAAGAERIILCDTNGGTMPWEVKKIVADVTREIHVPLGIHAHNDAELAVANSLTAIEQGVIQVQGTMNGIGERCGNANLSSIIPNLHLKMNHGVLASEQLKRLREVSHFVAEIANLVPNTHQPYVGDSAFAHKGGVHIDAVRKNPMTYEHVKPEVVGNRQRMLVSDHAGKSTLAGKAKEFHITLKKENPKTQELLGKLKELERQGYQFEGAEGSFELLMRRVLGKYTPSFHLLGFRVIVEKRHADEAPISEATVMVKVGSVVEHQVATGTGPVDALDHALRKALDRFFPELREIKLLDYKVRVLAGNTGTASKVRVLMESGDQKEQWGTVGVSENIIEASWQALADSIEYKMLKKSHTSKP